MKRKFILFLTIVILLLPSLFTVGCKKEDDQDVNLVLQIEFADTQSQFSQSENQALAQAFNGSKNSLDNFIYLNSNGNKTLKSNMLGVVKIDKSIDYFMPKYRYNVNDNDYELVNEEGYDNRYFDEEGNPSTSGKQSAERFFREQELLYLSTQKAQELTKKLGKKPEFENLTLVPSKLNRLVYTGDIFHPHQAKNFTGERSKLASSYYLEGVNGTIKESKIAKTDVESYVIIPFAYIFDGETTNITTLCHEYMHVLGVPDLYTYSEGNKKPVGEFDVMGGEWTAEPTQSLSYVKYKMGWLKEGEDILPITCSGEYTLTAVEDEGGVKAYKITLGDYYEKGDVFYLEYRKLGKGSLSDEETEGVIIYRVNEENGYITSSGEKSGVWRGNSYGDYEVIVFRNPQDFIYGNHTTICEEDGYSSFGNPNGNVNKISNSDGTNSQILVTYLGKNADGTVKVDVQLPIQEISVPREKVGIAEETGSRHSVYFGEVDKNCKVYVYYSPKRIKNATPDKIFKNKNGELLISHTAFLKATLPSAGGMERYVYVFYEQDDGYSNVIEYKIQGIKNVKMSTVLVIAVGLGIVVPYTALTLLNKISKKGEKKDGQSK